MDAMQSQEDLYLEPPEAQSECGVCGSKLRNGQCPYCNVLDEGDVV